MRVSVCHRGAVFPEEAPVTSRERESLLEEKR